MSHGLPRKLTALLRRKIVLVISCAAAIAGALFLGRVQAGPPDIEVKLPGKIVGRTESRWVAPYTLFTSYGVGDMHVDTVRWFDDKGGAVKELAGNLEARTDYIVEYRPDGSTYHDVNGKWSLVLPRKPEGSITAAGDTFTHQYEPEEGMIAADIYAAGKLIGTVGPFVQYKGRGVHLAADGSIAFMAWTNPKKEAVQVVVAGPDGKVSFRADCGQDVDNPIPVCGGKGVVVDVVGSPENHPRVRYMQAGRGYWVSFECGPNGFPMAGRPDGSGLLFNTSIGEEETFKLIDPATGKVLWEIPSPVRYYKGYATSAVVFDDKLLFIGQDFAAVDFKTGEVIARWEPNTSRSDRGWFARRGSRLFFVTGEEFLEIDPADIAARKNGWK